MKTFAKKIVLLLLRMMAKHRMRKFRGRVIAVTGSVGKTSTKEAIFTVLNTRFKVKRTKKSMNTEFGLPLTILDIDSGFSSATKWTWYLVKGFWHCFTRDHSEILLLEFGVDKPKDMDALISLIKPDVVVITSIAHTHLADGQFANVEEVFAEKAKLAAALKENGVLVLNVDNEYLAKLAKGRKKSCLKTFGTERDCDFWASQIRQSLTGIDFVLHYDQRRFDVHANVIGEYQVYVLLPAIVCGVLFDMSVEKVCAAVELFKLPPGRMSAIETINEAIILDSSYNSSPLALKEALKVLSDLGEKRRKVAVLGSMNELGNESKNLHQMIGEMLPDYVDMLLTVGREAKVFAHAAREKGMNEKNIFEFETANQAAEFFKEKIKKNDLVLVKGSQNNVRLERFVKALMAHTEDAKDLLVRQERIWNEI